MWFGWGGVVSGRRPKLSTASLWADWREGVTVSTKETRAATSFKVVKSRVELQCVRKVVVHLRYGRVQLKCDDTR